MSLIANIGTQDDIADEKDSIGSGGPVDSALYPMTISLAYFTKSKNAAIGMVIHFKTEDDREVRQTVWMTSGKDKGGKNYYERDGQKHYLPGFIHANAIALLTVGKEIAQVDTEMKTVNVYNPEVKAEVPTQVEVPVELLGQEVLVGLIKQTVDKNEKGDDGIYRPTGETRQENEIDKIFRASDRMTTAEIRAKSEEAVFADQWDAKWTGKERNKAKGASGTSGAPAGGMAAAGSKKPTQSLFGTSK